MAFLLDTNVVCEATAKQPDSRVLAWCREHDGQSFLSCVTVGEIRKGILLLPEGKRKKGLLGWLEGIERDFAGRILPMDCDVFGVWASLYAKNEANGRNLGVIDSLIAATALHHGLTVATRNTTDFPAEVAVCNPWK